MKELLNKTRVKFKQKNASLGPELLFLAHLYQLTIYSNLFWKKVHPSVFNISKFYNYLPKYNQDTMNFKYKIPINL